jgi:hypothetical protein
MRWTIIKTFQLNNHKFRISRFQPNVDKVLYCAGIKTKEGWTAFTLDFRHYSDLEHKTAEAAEAFARRYAKTVYKKNGELK